MKKEKQTKTDEMLENIFIGFISLCYLILSPLWIPLLLLGVFTKWIYKNFCENEKRKRI